MDEPACQEFESTRWSIVLSARGTDSQAQQALAELCQIYLAAALRLRPPVLKIHTTLEKHLFEVYPPFSLKSHPAHSTT